MHATSVYMSYQAYPGLILHETNSSQRIDCAIFTYPVVVILLIEM